MSNKQKMKLILEDGTSLEGKSFAAEKPVSGEVVFNTAMTGYPESLTDPSYKGQILVLTYPLIGNYGAPRTEMENNLNKFHESGKIHISGLIVSDYSFEYSHWNAEDSLGNWLKKNNFNNRSNIDVIQHLCSIFNFREI